MNTPGRNVRRARYVFLTTNGLGPWICRECNELIYQIGKHQGMGHIHHKDEDVTNDVPDNLEILHGTCHTKLHMKGVPHTTEHSAKVGRKGRVFTPEWRAKLTARQLTRVQCPDCDYVHTPQYVGRHRKKEHV